MNYVFVETLACPICREKLVFEDNSIHCRSCNKHFEKHGDTISFICKEMYSTEEEYDTSRRIIEFWGAGWEKRLSGDEHKTVFALERDALNNYVQEVVQFHKENHSLIGNELDLRSLKDKTVLNIGCGAGTESLILASYGAHCIGMDITTQAVGAADALIKKINGSGCGIQSDARYIPCKTDMLDIVYSSGVLHHSPNINKSIEEVYRVLKPEGKAYIMLYATWSLQFLQQRIRGILTGNLSKKKQLKYMSSTSEQSWVTGSLRNPLTLTFSRRQCRKLFGMFRSVKIRKGSFNLNQLLIINKLITRDVLTAITNKYLTFLNPYLGACLFIEAKK